MCDVISRDPEIMGGTPVFKETRVPISTLFDYLSGVSPDEDPISDFLENFPTVSAEQVTELLDYYREKAEVKRQIA